MLKKLSIDQTIESNFERDFYMHEVSVYKTWYELVESSPLIWKFRYKTKITH